MSTPRYGRSGDGVCPLVCTGRGTCPRVPMFQFKTPICEGFDGFGGVSTEHDNIVDNESVLVIIAFVDASVSHWHTLFNRS